MDSYKSILQAGKAEYVDQKSTFLGFASPVTSEEEALQFIHSVKEQHPAARHHVYAYVLRENACARFTDDGEPQGTAGLPVLDTIRKPALTNAAVVVVRYFGGILLGKGGLVHAYSAAARDALLDAVPIQHICCRKVRLTVSYADYQKILPELQTEPLLTVQTEFSDAVHVDLLCPQDEYAVCEKRITERSGGRGIFLELGEEWTQRKQNI